MPESPEERAARLAEKAARQEANRKANAEARARLLAGGSAQGDAAQLRPCPWAPIEVPDELRLDVDGLGADEILRRQAKLLLFDLNQSPMTAQDRIAAASASLRIVGQGEESEGPRITFKSLLTGQVLRQREGDVGDAALPDRAAAPVDGATVTPPGGSGEG